MSATLVESGGRVGRPPGHRARASHAGLPGLAAEFTLVILDDDSLLLCPPFAGRPGAARFLVVPPALFFPGLRPEVGDGVVSELEIGSAEEALVLLVLKAGDSPRGHDGEAYWRP